LLFEHTHLVEMRFRDPRTEDNAELVVNSTPKSTQYKTKWTMKFENKTYEKKMSRVDKLIIQNNSIIHAMSVLIANNFNHR